MRKIIGVIFFIALFASLQAQSFVSGAFSYDNRNSNLNRNDGTLYTYDNSGTSFIFTTRYGYNLNDKWAIGLGLNYYSTNSTYTSSNSPDLQEYNSSMISFAPFARYTFATAGKFKFLVDGVVGYGIGTTTEIVSEAESKFDDNQFIVRVVPVIQFDFNEKWSLVSAINVFGLGYSSSTSKGDNQEKSEDDFYIGAGTNLGTISIGAQYVF